MAAAFAALSLGLLLYWNSRPTVPVEVPSEAGALHFATRHGEQQVHRLADNSVLHLNTDSAVTIRYSSKERLVVLNAGEVQFEVAHEPDRAFRVSAGAAQVVAVGTQFDVRLVGDSSVVTVIEGRVSLAPANAAAQRIVNLSAGQQMSVAPGEWPPAGPVAVDPQRTTSWLRRQIMFDHETLEHVTGEFNRYAQKPIEIATPALRKMEISGVFATDDTAAFIAFLRSLDGVRVEESATRIRVSRD